MEVYQFEFGLIVLVKLDRSIVVCDQRGMKQELYSVGEMSPEPEGSGEPTRSYSVVTGRVDAKPAFVKALLHAAWLRRIVYNAAIDARVPFGAGVDYRLSLAWARRNGAPKPLPPSPSPTFLPVPKPFDINQVLTELRARHAELAAMPATMLRTAVAEACEARARHVRDCAAAKAAGRRLSRLSFRSAGDDLDVATDAVRVLRCGDGPARQPAKRGAGERYLRRRRVKQAQREAQWAKAKEQAGWNPPRIAAGLERRAARQDRDRQLEIERQAGMSKRSTGTVRRDSPQATVGASRLKLEVKGLGRVRVRLSRPLPEGAEIVRVHFVKEHGTDSRVEARIVVRVPVGDKLDELETGRRLHDIVAVLPANASPLAAVEAVRAAGVPIRGDDWGVSAPSTDDTGRKTSPVRAIRVELEKTRDLQRRLSHKDAVALAAVKATAESTEVAAPSTDYPEPKQRKRRPKRSKRAGKVLRQIRSRERKAANRSRTKAQQDARALVRGAVLVATDPQRMVRGLLAKGGPSERHERAEEGEAVVTTVERSPRGWAMTSSQQRALRRNMHSARPALRIARVKILCEAAGVIHATPGHEGSSRTCPGCGRVEAKSLTQRRHVCEPCGLDLDRDHASAVVTLGRALLEFHEGPDPAGRIAARRAEQEASVRKAEAVRERRAAGGRKSGARRRALAHHDQAGATPAGTASCAVPHQGVVALGVGLRTGAEHRSNPAGISD